MKDLSGFQGYGYDKGRPKAIQALWLLTQSTLLQHWWFPPKLRVKILRAFGAKIEEGVLIRHGVTIHWPWKLEIKKNSWVGVGTWILNLEQVTIGENSCLSQDTYICTGSHLFNHDNFEFDNAPIVIGDRVWVTSRASILRGVTVGDDSVVGAMALVTKDVPAGSKVLAPLGDVSPYQPKK